MEDILKQTFGISIWSVAKLIVLFALLIYLVFSIVIIRQVKMMAQTLNGNLNLPIKTVAWVHLAVVLLVIALALIIL